MKIKTFLIYSKSAVHTVALFHFTQKKINCATVKSKKKKNKQKNPSIRVAIVRPIFISASYNAELDGPSPLLLNSSIRWTSFEVLFEHKFLHLIEGNYFAQANDTRNWHIYLVFAGCLSRHINMNTKSWQSERQTLVIQKIGISLGL